MYVASFMIKVKVPPIKCQGIKTKLIPWIIHCIDWDKNGTWIEPFLGSGAVGFNVAPEKAIFNDANPHIIKFYDSINKDIINARIVREFLESEGNKLLKGGKEYYYEVRERFNKNFEPLDFLFLNRSCFNGVIRFNKKGKFNVPFNHKSQRFAKAYITKIVNQVAHVHMLCSNNDWSFLNQPFTQSLASLSENDFIYCDPPYVGRHVDYYGGWDDVDEHKLFALLKDSPCRFILSTWHGNKYRENTYIAELWSHFNIYTKEHFYHVGASENNRTAMTEALATNFQVCPKQQEETANKEDLSMAI